MSGIAWFREIGPGDIDRAGGKGANLGELSARGIPVPPGFIVTAGAYTAFLSESGVAHKLHELLAELPTDGFDGASEIAARVQHTICEAPMPSDLAAAIRQAYSELGGGPVAVRSSATAEDLAEASFAGQQSTYLNVSGEQAVLKAVQECWASLYEERAIVYRRRNGFDDSAVHIAVVVQSMVQSERSGIMFTINPVTGDAGGIVIEAIFGLGEAAVSGMVTPDMYILDKHTLDIQQREISHQEQQLVRADTPAAGAEPNCWKPVPADLGRAQKLSDDQLRALAELGIRIEQHYGSPQDIEWALSGGEFFILQARPVTAAGL